MKGLQPFAPAKNQLPSSWSDCTLSPDVPFCLVMLNKQSWEFQSILAEFEAAGLTVKKIERVENRDLWDKFQFERTRMLKNRTGGRGWEKWGGGSEMRTELREKLSCITGWESRF